MKIFETHVHLDDSAFDEDREALIEEMLGENGTLDIIVNVGASLSGCKSSLMLSAKYNRIYAAIGFHPEDVYGLNISDIEWLESNVSDKTIAIGEIGLEYHYLSENEKEATKQKEIQAHWFREQLKLARRLKLPVIIHSREACKDTLEILKEFYDNSSTNSGIIHCYSYSVEAMKEFLDMGFYIGIGGVVTFKNAKKLLEVAKAVPEDKLLLETDAPYMAPVPFRGKRNDSRLISYVAEKIAELRGTTPQHIIDVTNLNARSLFNIGDNNGL